MKKIAFLIFISINCACNLQAQVWTNLIDSVRSQVFQVRKVVRDEVNDVLYFGGIFHHTNQFVNKGILKFDGANFDTLRSGLDDYAKPYFSATAVSDLIMFQNKLYVFGDFHKAGRYYSDYVGRWNGSDWDTIDFKFNSIPMYSEVYNNELYVAGAFTTVAGMPCNSIAKFDGVNWHSLSHPVQGNIIEGIAHFKDRLYIAGQYSSASSSANLSYYDGTNWVPWVGVSGDVNKAVFGIKVIDSLMFVYGRFNSIAGTNCKGLAAFSGNRWYGFGQGLATSGWETVYDVEKINGELYVTGIFDKIEGIGNSVLNQNLATNLAKFDGEKWCLISPPFDNVVTGVISYKNNMYCYGAYWRCGADSLKAFVRWSGGNTTLQCSPNISLTIIAVGLSEQPLLFQGLKIYPNPAHDVLTVESPAFEDMNGRIKILNSLGQQVSEIKVSGIQTSVDLSNLPPGIYFLNAERNGQQKAFKIVKE